MRYKLFTFVAPSSGRISQECVVWLQSFKPATKCRAAHSHCQPASQHVERGTEEETATGMLEDTAGTEARKLPSQRQKCPQRTAAHGGECGSGREHREQWEESL